MEEETLIAGTAREFPETRWSIVRSARQDESTRRAALEELLATYWKPLYFYVRRKGNSVEAAKDSVQGFCVHLLERDFFAKPDPARGRFRACAWPWTTISEESTSVSRRRNAAAA